MTEIERLTVVSAQGVSYHKVGVNGVTHIFCMIDQISEKERGSFYYVMKGDHVHARISATCPLEVIYQKE